MIHPDSILAALRSDLGLSIKSIRAVPGGDINRAFKVELTNGKALFVKANASPLAPAMFTSEAIGLNELNKNGLATPAVVHIGTETSFSFLVLEWIIQGKQTSDAWKQLGWSLARMHLNEQDYFGWHTGGFIGTLPQINTRDQRWSSFYWQNRLEKQWELALEKQAFPPAMTARFSKLQKHLADFFPDEPPALLHGDLWRGNVMTTIPGKGIFIDPAAYYGHREMDVAMTLLFGGFPHSFYDAYQEVYPLEPEWRNRTAIGQLYYILVHVNLFGGSYTEQAQEIIRMYT